MKFLNHSRNPCIFIFFTLRTKMNHFIFIFFRCIQFFLQTILIILNYTVRNTQDCICRTIVLIQHDCFCIWKILFKMHNNIYIRTTPCINCLVRITNNIQGSIFTNKKTNQLILKIIDILKLVYKYIFKSSLPFF